MRRRKEAGEAPEVLAKGWLQKEGRVRKSMKRRWFMLTSEKLSYYAEPKTHLKGIIHLKDRDCKVMVNHSKGQHGFGLISADRTWYFCAPSEDDRVIWVNALLDLGMGVDNPEEIGEPDYSEPAILPSQPGLNRNRPLAENSPLFEEEYESSEEKVFERILSLPDQPGVPPKPKHIEKVDIEKVEEVPLEIVLEDERKEEHSSSPRAASDSPHEHIPVKPVVEDEDPPIELPPAEDENPPIELPPAEDEHKEEQKLPDADIVIDLQPGAPPVQQDEPDKPESFLPVGWERKLNVKTGEYFYIDHNTNTHHKTRPSEDYIVSNFV